VTWSGLIGTKLNNGWTVDAEVAPKPGQTGGNFSNCFEVSRGNEKAFMKAFNLEKIISITGSNFQAMQQALEGINFEVHLLEVCESAATKNVIIPIESGKIAISNLNLGQPIQYLIFGMADGDLRTFHRYNGASDVITNLSILKEAASGLGELHRLEIAHQDLKPSNVLVFRGNSSKIADLGRSVRQGDPVWHDQLEFSGDRGYAPPEVLYRDIRPEWYERRVAQDLYMLGSLGIFLFSSVNLTASMLLHLEKKFHPTEWKQNYRDVLPYVLRAYSEVLSNNLLLPNGRLGGELLSVFKELCHPEPARRGNPRIANLPTRYSLQRYVSIFERLRIAARVRGL
jgi:serine/threonine protein kinase